MKFNGTWIPEKVYKKYRGSCKDVNLLNFKTNKNYRGVVGNDTRNYQTTKSFYDYIMEHYSLLSLLFDRFFTNDTIGEPVTHTIDGREMSCGTLRFIKVIGDLFMKHKIEALSIAEIGCGYGGQCKALKEYSPLSKYTCIDIPEAIELIRDYLDYFEMLDGVELQTTNDVKEDKYDLVISDYCLSELDSNGVDFYIENVIKDSKYGYFTINAGAPVRDHLLKRLNEVYNSVNIEPEIPATSKHKNEIIFCS